MVSELQGEASISHPFIGTYCFFFFFLVILILFFYVSGFAVQLGFSVVCLCFKCTFNYSLFAVISSEQQKHFFLKAAVLCMCCIACK